MVAPGALCASRGVSVGFDSSPPSRWVTVSVAAAENWLPQALLNRTRYWLPFWANVAGKLSDAPVAPLRSLKLPPPLGIICHWTAGAGAPVAETLKLALAPASTVTFAGSLATAGLVHVPKMVVLVWKLLLLRYASTLPAVSHGAFSDLPPPPPLVASNQPHTAS